jgi:muconolactone D-isomerase
MEFLVEIQVNWPPSNDEQAKAALIEAEGERGRELARDGVIVRLWRIPGRWANVGIWEAPDATTLHEALASLPAYPWLDAKVTALARHPTDPGRGDR